MSHPWDEFSKSLAESVPRRESLRRLGVVLAGAVLGPLGTASAASRRKSAGGSDPCRTFCKCTNKRQQNACLAVCRACTGATRRLCGSCGGYYCADLANDVFNCGACGYVCPWPGRPNEYRACVNGNCVYSCVDGAVLCDGTCTFLGSDPNNCGACGNVCGGATPYCIEGACADCERCGEVYCVDFQFDINHCGACGVLCPVGTTCLAGVCQALGPPPPP